MSKTTITVRVDAQLKADAEGACEHLGLTLTAAVHMALRDVIQQSNDFATLLAKHEGNKSNLYSPLYLTHDEKKRLIKYLGGFSRD